jgi:hypothetical protein
LTKEEIATPQATTPDERRGESALGSDERLPRPPPRLLFSASPGSGTPAGRKTANGQNRQGAEESDPITVFLYLAGFEHQTDRIPTFYIFVVSSTLF